MFTTNFSPDPSEGTTAHKEMTLKYWLMNKPLYANVSAPRLQRRCLLFIVGVKTITQMNIEYAYISEEMEENNRSKMSFPCQSLRLALIKNARNSRWVILQLFVCKDKS